MRISRNGAVSKVFNFQGSRKLKTSDTAPIMVEYTLEYSRKVAIVGIRSGVFRLVGPKGVTLPML